MKNRMRVIIREQGVLEDQAVLTSDIKIHIL